MIAYNARETLSALGYTSQPLEISMNAHPKTSPQGTMQPDQIAEKKKSCCCADRNASAAPIQQSPPTKEVSACCGGAHSHGNGSADGK